MAVDEKERDRALTEAEQRRLEHYNQVSADLEAQGYRRTELTVGIVRANVIAVISAIPVMALAFGLFLLVNRGREPLNTILDNGLVSILVILALVVVHELIHGIGWSFFAPHRFGDIEFGFMKEYLTPYCTCTSPLDRTGYVVGSLAPLVVLGIIPTVVAIAIGSLGLLWIGLLMILSAGGDVMIVWMLLTYKSSRSDYLVIDHPTQAGSAIFER